MQVVFHLGAHCTDEDRLLKCLLKNRGPLAEQGIVVPGPSRYRAVIRETMIALRGRPASAEMQETVLDAIMDEDQPSRLILSNQSFLSAPARVLLRNELYAQADEKSHWLRQIFPDAQAAFFISIRNPATFLPALFARVKGERFEDFIDDMDPRAAKWSGVIARLRDANPDVPVTVWCNEDSPLIWTEILRRMSGHPPEMTLRGTEDFLATIMSRSGMERMQKYMISHPPASEIQHRRIVAAFLDKFALAEEVEMELDVPGWTEDLVEEITERYEEDIFAIERMEGIDFISP